MTTTEDAQYDAKQAAEGDTTSRLLQRLVTQVGGHARVQAVFGDPVERAGVTVIPVARVRWGVGGARYLARDLVEPAPDAPIRGMVGFVREAADRPSSGSRPPPVRPLGSLCDPAES
jgi:hypothetical protein